MLESLGFVERYSWFVDNYGGGANPENGRYSRLFNDDDTPWLRPGPPIGMPFLASPWMDENRGSG